ncbi:MAG: putative ATPase involved in replication initiation [Hyphomicrobiales bacterium]|nr:putative ATPase involved in replication initiation [Hyphomicrobiales bacterium]
MTFSTSHRLIVALYNDNSYAWRPDGDGGELRVVARRRNVSVETGRFPAEAGAALIGSGLAEWQEPGPSRRERLVLTAQGRARASLTQGDNGVEPARIFHGDVVRTAGALVEEAESPLAWLARRRGKDGAPLLSSDHLQAGERLRRDFELARTLPRVTSRWDGMPGAGAAAPQAGPVTDMALAARQRVEAAMQAVGPEFSGLLIDVCGFLKGLETVESERRWPRRSGRIVLDLALGRLARHYGIGARPAPASAPMRHWGAQDYRPSLT